MKTIFNLVLLLVVYSFNGITQHMPVAVQPTNQVYNCGVKPPSQEHIDQTILRHQQSQNQKRSGITYLPINIHIVRTSSGSGGVDENWLALQLAQLNFFSFNIDLQWYISDVTYIDSDMFYTYDATSEEDPLCQPYEVDNALNIFIVNNIVIDGNNACGYSYYPSDDPQTLRLFLQNSCVESQWSGTLVHEIGHFFNLLHTHEATSEGNDNQFAENVPRVGPHANCEVSGDYICDTNADPYGTINASCQYTDGLTDSLGNIYIPPTNNIMSYYPRTCGWNLTQQQYQRMSDALFLRLNHASYNLGDDIATDIPTPSNLQASINDQYQVELSWDTNTDFGKAYIIERSIDGVDFQPLFLGGAGPTASSYLDASTASYETYAYRIKALNDIPDHYSNIAEVTTSGSFCIPSHQSDNCTAAGIGVGLQNVTISSCNNILLDNNSNCEGPLTVYSNTIPALDLVKSKTYDLQLAMISNGSSYIEQNVSMWIDSNQDGIFDDITELVYQSDFQSTAPSIIDAQFTLPSNSVDGNTTIRVRSRYRPQGTVDSPCDYYSFSEAEDYLINVMSPSNADPQISLLDSNNNPTDDILCPEQGVTLLASGGMYYLWDDGSTMPSRFVDTAGSYSVTITDDEFCDVVLESPIFDVDNSSNQILISDNSGAIVNGTVFCQGDTLDLMASSAMNYNWSNGSSQQSIPITTSGMFTVTLTDDYGCFDTLYQSIQFAAFAPTLVAIESSGLESNDNTICHGDTVQLIADGGQSYLWNNGDTQDQIAVFETGLYDVVVSDTIGCSSSLSVFIESINPDFPPVEIIENSSSYINDGILCEGDTALIISSGASLYQWSNGSLDSTITISNTASLHLERMDDFGCSAIDSINITSIPNELEISLIDSSGLEYNDGQICAGDSVLVVASGSQSYSWNEGDYIQDSVVMYSNETLFLSAVSEYGCQSSDSVSISVTTQIEMQIQVIDSSGIALNDGLICQGDSVHLGLPQDIISPFWNNGDTDEFIYISQDTSIIAFGYDGFNCIVSDTIDIVQSTNPQFVFLHDQNLIFGSELTLCQGDTAVISTSGDETSWTYNNSSTINISSEQWIAANAINEDECFMSDSVYVSFESPPEVQVSLSDNSGLYDDDGIICEMDSVLLSSSSDSDVIWSTGSTDPSIVISQSGLYKAFAFSNNGCVASDSAFISVRSLPDASIEAVTQSGDSSNGYLMPLDTIYLVANDSHSIVWSTGETSQSIDITSPGTYSLSISDQFECSSSDTITILSIEDSCYPIYDSPMTDSDNDGLTDCEELTGLDNISTALTPYAVSDPFDPCDPDMNSINCVPSCPDLTSNLAILPSNIQGVSDMNVIIDVSELNGVDTYDTIFVRVPNDDRLTFQYDNTLSSVSFFEVQNSDWKYEGSNGLFHVFYSTIVLNLDNTSFAFLATYDPQYTEGTTTISSTVVPFSAGDCMHNNNSDTEILIYFD